MTSIEKLRALWKQNAKDVHFYRQYCAPDAYSRRHREAYAYLKRGHSRLIGRYIQFITLLWDLGPALFIGYYLGFIQLWEALHKPSGPNWRDARFWVLWIAGWTAYYAFRWLLSRAYRLRIKAVATAVGGDWGKHRASSLLSWVDKNWDAYVPREFVMDQAYLLGAMDIQTTYEQHPVCLASLRWVWFLVVPLYARTSLLMAAPGRRESPSQAARGAEADLESMGWTVVDVEPGIYVYRKDVSIRTLNPITIQKTMALMAQMAAG